MPRTSSQPRIQEERPDVCRFPLSLIKTVKALRFGGDAFLLSAYACKCLEERFHSPKKVPLLVELGCADGTALLALLIKWPNAQALGIDFNADFIALAEENAGRLSLSASFLTLDVRNIPETPALKNLREKAHLVIANPPWRLPSEGHRSTNQMRNLALWAEADSLGVFVRAASFFLRHGGQFCSIIHPAILPMILKEMEKYSLGLREILPVASRKDQKAQRLLLRAQKNARALPIFLSPLIMHKENSSDFSEAALAFCPWLGKPEEKKPVSLEKI